MNTKIFVEGNELDISIDMDSLLTFALDDVKDFASRSTTFSKTVVIPGTSRNNAIFGNIFDTGSSNAFDPTLDNIGYNFNASKSAKCIIFQDNMQTFKGTMRMLEIDIYRGRIEYEIALNGDLTTLNVALSSGYLTDLDFSAYNALWNETTITSSWDNPGGSGLYFPLIDYGNYSVNKHDWDFRTMRPAIYAKEYIDKMFAAAGFRYNCTLFNTARFKSLIIPHNQKTLQSLVSQVLYAKVTSSHEVLRKNPGVNGISIMPWDSIIAGGFTYLAGVFTYTQPDTLTLTIPWDLRGTRIGTAGSFDILIRRNSIAVASTTIVTSPFVTNWNYSGAVSLTLNTGDTIDVQFVFDAGTNVVVTVEPGCVISLGSSTPVLQPVDYGQTITMNDTLPQNIRQVDFLMGIVQLFNLYVYEDQWDDRLINISPFINFYDGNAADVVDWTYKMDRDQAIKIKPMSELNSKLYNFNYASDSDYYNDLYNKRFNQGYGSYIFDTEFEFATQTTTVTLPFAPTPLVGYDGEEKVYPTIFKRTGTDAAPVEENVDSVIRIMQTKKVLGVSVWQIKNVATVLSSQSFYGYAGHFDDPDSPMDDLNFGALKQLLFILVGGDLTNTQFNVYWSAYMAEITDKDSKLLTASFYLTALDIFRLSFAHYVFVDGILYRLNKVSDYNATVPSTCLVELLRVINTSYNFVNPIPTPDTFRWLDSDGSFILDSDNSKILLQ